MIINEAQARNSIVNAARKVSELGLSHGSSGNISLRFGNQILVTPTGSGLAHVSPEDLALIDFEGVHLDGPKPSKEAFLHAAMLRARPHDAAAIHTHSTYSAAVSCLEELNPEEVLPPLTAYFAMKVGRVPLLPYHTPGDLALGPIAQHAATDHTVLLLRNHGPIAAGDSLEAAIERIEELEETARIFLLLGSRPMRPLRPDEVVALHVNR